MSERPHVAYVVYWGATEWLGEAVAVPSVEALARRYAVTLVTFEKPADATPERTGAMRARLRAGGIDWIPLRYRKRPPVLSSFADAFAGGRALRATHGARPLDLVVARTFVAGIAATGVCRALDVPLVYYLDACWPEEQVDHGHWRAGSVRHRAARALEDRTLGACAGLVTLTEGARRRVFAEARVASDLPAVVAPTVSDLVARASASDVRRPHRGGPLRFVYLGSFGGRKPMAPLLDVLEAAQASHPRSTLRVVSDEGVDTLIAAAAARGLGALVAGGGVPHERVGETLARHDVGLVFLEAGASAPCQTPTKVGEYLAYGLPVLCNRAVGDVPELLEHRGVGVVMDGHGVDAARRAVAGAARLAADASLPTRARDVAREAYSMPEVTARQIALIDGILERRARADARP